MSGRITPLINGGFYHIYNRGSEKRNIYQQPRDYMRFLKTLYYYQFLGPKPKFSNFTKTNLFKSSFNSKIVEIICYCLMPNHFHFLIKQLKDGGISIFMSQLSNSYTKYFNTKYNRVGPLLQGAFKAIRIENDEQFVHVSRYIHLNPIVSGLVKNLDDHQWSSYLEYIQSSGLFCSPAEILNFFSSKDKYKQFVLDQVDYGTTLELIKHHLDGD